METSFANLATPATTISFHELEKNKSYKILKFRVVDTKYKDSAVVDILVDNEQKAIFLPKRFMEMSSKFSDLNEGIERGNGWLLIWQGPAGRKSNNVLIQKS